MFGSQKSQFTFCLSAGVQSKFFNPSKDFFVLLSFNNSRIIFVLGHGMAVATTVLRKSEGNCWQHLDGSSSGHSHIHLTYTMSR